MSRIEFTELTPEGRRGIKERFPEIFREKETKTTYTYGRIPFNPSRHKENPEVWTLVIRREREKFNWRTPQDRYTVVKELTVRIPDEWVKAEWGDSRYRGPLTKMLSFS